MLLQNQEWDLSTARVPFSKYAKAVFKELFKEDFKEVSKEVFKEGFFCTRIGTQGGGGWRASQGVMDGGWRKGLVVEEGRGKGLIGQNMQAKRAQLFKFALRRTMEQRSILGVKPAAPSDIAGLCKNISHPVSHFQTSLS